MNLDFLSSVKIDETVDKKPRTGGGVKKERNPQGLAIRLYKDGAVYPSKELVDKFALEYAGKGVEHGYGFDVVDTSLFPKFGSPQRILIISKVKKSAGKVDLFSTVGYDDNGNKLVSVLEQGAKTFGASDLIPAVEAIYGKKFGTEEGEIEYLDLALVPNPATGEPWKMDVAFVPKKVSRGVDKGLVKTERRENLEWYAFVPAEAAPQPASYSEDTSSEEPVLEEQEA